MHSVARYLLENWFDHNLPTGEVEITSPIEVAGSGVGFQTRKSCIRIIMGILVGKSAVLVTAGSTSTKSKARLTRDQGHPSSAYFRSSWWWWNQVRNRFFATNRNPTFVNKNWFSQMLIRSNKNPQPKILLTKSLLKVIHFFQAWQISLPRCQ